MLVVIQTTGSLYLLTLAAQAQGLEKIEYFADSIIEKEDSHMSLFGGSSWVLLEHSLALVTHDVIVVFKPVESVDHKRAQTAVAYLDGEKIAVRHSAGTYSTQTGYFTTVIEALADGAVLKLGDGTFLSVPEYDRFDTGWWLPPYEALLTASKLYLYNLGTGRRVWVNPVR